MKKSIREEIEQFIAHYQERRHTATKWRKPLVGFASAGDTLFKQLKSAVSVSHALPKDLLPEARTVIAFFVPFEKSVARSNISGMLASLGWAQAYIETNALIEAIGEHMKTYINSSGYAVAVTPPTHNFDKEKLISDWSHRHVAFAAGLGNFGLNNMLITESGCCGRIGSFLTSVDVPPNTRMRAETCLYRYDSSCLRCVERCVNGALHKDHFDRNRCYDMCLRNEDLFRETGKADVCGKCLVGLPCSFINPLKKKNKKH
jgi:epoxyqueuosine reductase QueG